MIVLETIYNSYFSFSLRDEIFIISDYSTKYWKIN